MHPITSYRPVWTPARGAIADALGGCVRAVSTVIIYDRPILLGPIFDRRKLWPRDHVSLREEDVNGIRELGGFMVPLNDMLKARNGDFRHDTVFFFGEIWCGSRNKFYVPAPILGK